MTVSACVRGPLLQSRFEWLRRHHGAEAVGRVMGELPGAHREALTGVERDGWYPFASYVALEETIVRVFGHGNPRLGEELGADAARTRFVWLRGEAPYISVHSLLSRAADDHHFFYDFGESRYTRRGFTSGEMDLVGFAETSPTFCSSFRGYLLAITRLIGAVDPTVVETECQADGAPRCAFRIRWVSPGSDSGPVFPD
jgi:predicted hydrocarbon binding protein